MNAIKSLLAVVATVAATGAFAAEATPDTWVRDAHSVATRQDVREQAIDARVAGQIGYGEATIVRDTSASSSVLTREQVRAEARDAARHGLIKSGEA